MTQNHTGTSNEDLRGGPFDKHSTAADVLAGVDLTGRTALVTGGYSGIGLATARALAAAGAKVVVPARRPEAAEQELGDTAGVEVDQLDLADLESVRTYAVRFRQRHATLDILIANAGVMACPETRVGPGWEAQFATNHLGHYALVNLLWPALTAAGTARVVSVASGRDPSGQIRWDDPQFTKGYDKWAAYGQSKLANVLFARHLDRLGEPYGVRALSANPGWILTPLQRHLSVDEMVAAGWIDADGNALPGLFKTPEQGASTILWAATSPELDKQGGAYCADCQVVDGDDPAADRVDAARLWRLSAELTGIDRVSSS